MNINRIVSFFRRKKEEQADGAAPLPEKPVSRRILRQVLKTLFIRLPVTLLIIISLVLIVLEIYLSPGRVERLITENFNSRSNGVISLKVKEFSPYNGFVMENIQVQNGPQFNNSKLFTMDKIVIKYGLFPMLIGNLRIHEIGLYNPRVLLEQKGGIWSPAVLMKPSDAEDKKDEEKEKKEKKPKDKADKEDSGYIDLPISVEFFFKFILQDLRVNVVGEDFRTSMTGLTFTADIDVPPFKRIPKSIEAVSLLKEMKFQLNPEEEMNVAFYSKDAAVDPQLILTWKLLFNKNAPNGDKPVSRFESSLKFGTYKTPVRLQKIHLAPLSFMVSYDLFFNPYNDTLTLNHFAVKFKDADWINIAGTVKEVSKSQVVDINMARSRIDLSDLYPYFLNFTGDRKTRFSGAISLMPLTVNGTVNNMKVRGEVNLDKIFFRNPGVELSMPSLKLGYSVDKNGNDMKLGTEILSPFFTYALEGNRSGGNGLYFGADVDAYGNFASVKINRVDLRLFSSATKTDALNVNITGQTRLQPKLVGTVNVNRFRFQKQPLEAMVPSQFKKQVKSIPLKKPLDVSLALNYDIGPQVISAGLATLVKVPDFDLDDLTLKLAVIQDAAKQRVTLRSLHLQSKKWHADVKSSGFVELKEQPISKADLNFSVSVDNPQEKNVAGPWVTSGLIKLSGAFKGDLKTGVASGSFLIDKFNVKNPKMRLDVKDVNMNFPFAYSLKQDHKNVSLLEVGKGTVTDNENFREASNFSIASIKAAHPARKEAFEYMKDFSTYIGFKDNLFMISNLKTYVLDGSIYGRSIAFNLADMKRQNMEFRMNLDVTNVDIGKLDNPDPSAKKRDAELSLNANFAGRGLNFKKGLDWKGYINIYKIGEKIASRLLKGLSAKKGKSNQDRVTGFIVDNAMYVQGFNFNLDKGLVYTTVPLKRGLMGYAVGIYDDKIEFERMPIQEYLRNIIREEN
jgi:hypothetical protein